MYKKYFKKSFILVILGFLVAFCTLITKVVSVNHWNNLGYNVTGIAFEAPAIVLIGSSAMLGVLYFRKIKAPSLWIMAVSGIVYGVIMAYTVWY